MVVFIISKAFLHLKKKQMKKDSKYELGAILSLHSR